MRLGAQLADPQFGGLAATAGAEFFFHGFHDDLRAVSHVVSHLPDASDQAAKLDQIRQSTMWLAISSGLMAPLDAMAVAARAPLLEEFSRLLPQLALLKERNRGIDCLIEKTPDLPLAAQLVIADNLAHAIGACVEPHGRPQTLDHIAALAASSPLAVRSQFLRQLSTHLAELPAAHRQSGFTMLLTHATQLEAHCNPDYLCRLVGAVTDLPGTVLQHAAWVAVSELINTLPQPVPAEPIIALIGSIGVLTNTETKAHYLAQFGPHLFGMQPAMRHQALLNMIDAIPQLPAGEVRDGVLQQTALLMNVSDVAAHHVELQLRALIKLLPHLEVGDESVGVLQMVVQQTRGLPDSERTAVLESVPQNFCGWQNKNLIKPAVLLISRECQGALPAIKGRLVTAITTGLLAVCHDLQAELEQMPPGTLPKARISAWFQTAAIAPAPGRTRLLQAADDLVESAWRRDPAQGHALLHIYGQHFSHAMQTALAERLGIPEA